MVETIIRVEANADIKTAIVDYLEDFVKRVGVSNATTVSGKSADAARLAGMNAVVEDLRNVKIVEVEFMVNCAGCNVRQVDMRTAKSAVAPEGNTVPVCDICFGIVAHDLSPSLPETDKTPA